MKLLRLECNGIPNLKNEFSFDLYATQKVNEDKNEMVSNLFNNIYSNNTIALLGLNASGKTTVLKFISFVLNMLQNKALNSNPFISILNDLECNKEATIKTYFYDNILKSMFKLETTISCFKDETNNKIYNIVDEVMYSKTVSSIRSKEKLFTYTESNICDVRNNYSNMLLDDVSIILKLNKERKSTVKFYNSINWTNLNALRLFGAYPEEIVSFLDPSIEYLKCSSFDDEDVSFSLKFYNKEEIIINSMPELNKYLSSGTIKGINLFILAILTLKNGSYLLIDELENHFNIEIVYTLINFFNDKKLNPNGATLIFSTHYIELIDKFTRNDCVNIIRNMNGITLDNLSDLLKRNDKNKSEWFKSGYLEHTTPSYDNYISLKRKIVANNQTGDIDE